MQIQDGLSFRCVGGLTTTVGIQTNKWAIYNKYMKT